MKKQVKSKKNDSVGWYATRLKDRRRSVNIYPNIYCHESNFFFRSIHQSGLSTNQTYKINIVFQNSY